MEGIEDESFGVDLLNVLTRGYRNSSDQETEDKYAFAIQVQQPIVVLCMYIIHRL